MISNQINNRKGFNNYVIVNFLLTIIGFSIAIISIIGMINKDLGLLHLLIPDLRYAVWLIFLIFSISFFGLFVWLVSPSYIEVIISEREIILRTFKPNKRNGLSFIHMVRYRKYLKEFKISKLEYNDYKLIIDKFGFRKRLILQKINNNGLYQTSEINISFLDQRKYTDLILSMDRMRTKINLN